MSAFAPCPHCGAVPTSALVCEACGTLLEPRADATPFALFGLEPAHALDLGVLQKRRLALTRALHPDFHGTEDAQTRRLAEDSTAALNQAHALLADDFRRAEWLLAHLGAPREGEQRGLPATFLAEVLEWNETIAAARAGESSSALAELRAQLEAQRERARRTLATEFVPLSRDPEVLRRARQTLESVRYVERALRQIGELELAARRA